MKGCLYTIVLHVANEKVIGLIVYGIIDDISYVLQNANTACQ